MKVFESYNYWKKILLPLLIFFYVLYLLVVSIIFTIDLFTVITFYGLHQSDYFINKNYSGESLNDI